MPLKLYLATLWSYSPVISRVIYTFNLKDQIHYPKKVHLHTPTVILVGYTLFQYILSLPNTHISLV